MQFIPVKTRPLLPPQDDIYPVLDESLPALRDNDIVLIASKVISIHQGRCIPMGDVADKDELIKQEAEAYIDRVECPGGYVVLTIKGHTLVASAGIDESNTNGYYSLWPERVNAIAKDIRDYLQKKFGLAQLAIIITDSRFMPLRYGAVGVAIGGFGINPIRDYRQTPDIFGRMLIMSRSNVVDSLASAAVLMMGEGDEQIPIVIARDVPRIDFTAEDIFGELFMPVEEDIYYPLLKKFYERQKK